MDGAAAKKGGQARGSGGLERDDAGARTHVAQFPVESEESRPAFTFSFFRPVGGCVWRRPPTHKREVEAEALALGARRRDAWQDEGGRGAGGGAREWWSAAAAAAGRAGGARGGAP